jgi:hypothetical protein
MNKLILVGAYRIDADGHRMPGKHRVSNTSHFGARPASQIMPSQPKLALFASLLATRSLLLAARMLLAKPYPRRQNEKPRLVGWFNQAGLVVRVERRQLGSRRQAVRAAIRLVRATKWPRAPACVGPL